MSDATKAPIDLTAAQADFLATRPDTTYRDLLAAGVGVYGFVKEHYRTRLAALEAADRAWVASGRPKDVRPTAPPATEREPIPPAAEPLADVRLPEPSTVTSLRELARLGPAEFAAFKHRHPAEYEALRAKGFDR